MYNNRKIAGIFLIFALAVFGCKKWEKHTEVTQQDLSINLLDAISSNAGLSKFREYIGLAGLDSLLMASKTYTVWAPDNTALQSIDPAVVSDKVKLKAFILNHISNQLYFTRDVANPLRIQMLSGKYNNFSTIKFDEAGLGVMDKYVKNGVLHTIKAIAPPLQNIWEYVNSTTGQYAQNAYLVSLNYNSFDPSKAIIDSISVVTGLPVYRPGTGIVQRNYFNDRVYDLQNESKQYTYFVMQDNNFVVESDSLKNYFVTGVAASTDSLTRWNVVKDLAYETAYQTPFAIPQPLISKSGINVPVNNAFVVDIKKMSNGYVYIMSKLDVPTINKFLTITIQGETPTGFLQNDRTAFINYRVRQNPVNGINYNDIVVSGHGVTAFYSFYRLNEIPSIKYQVYAKAINDFQATAFNQTITAWNVAGNVFTLQGSLSYAVPLNTATGAYNEINLGTVTNTKYGTLDWRLTAVTTGPFTLDYLRLVPVP